MKGVEAVNTVLLEPIQKAIQVRRSPGEAFEIFTSRLADWWPLEKYSICQGRAVSCGMERRVGGELFEVRDDGQRFPWGRILDWSPPDRLAFTWHPGREPEAAQEVEIRFIPHQGGTRVELEHRNWEILGDKAAQIRQGYAAGWSTVFEERFAQACA